MALFLTLFLKLLPLYGIIVLGFVATHFLKVQKESIALLLLYVLSPLIVFHGAYTASLQSGVLFLPLFFFLSACGISTIAYFVGGMVWKDNTRNIFAYSAATGNTGYFGIPVALALLGNEVLGTIVLSTMGLIFFENTMGFFITARGTHTVKESIYKVLCLPTLYGFLLGILLNALHIGLPKSYFAIIQDVRGAYALLGMMIIGMGIAGFKRLEVDAPFLGLSFFAKFLFWPAYTFAAVIIDQRFLHLLSLELHTIMLLLSLMPMAANTVVLATALRVKPEKAALGVLSTTLFALFFIPFVLTFIKI